jgi:hypothetical protein
MLQQLVKDDAAVALWETLLISGDTTFRSLSKYCTAWARFWWGKYLEIAQRSWVFSPRMIAPSGAMFSTATVTILEKSQILPEQKGHVPCKYSCIQARGAVT